jgi:NAD(P)-dependent dehydrogenase (short-subunit alcohol dehydrogenase family)
LRALAEDVVDRIIATNLKGVWLSMKYEIPQMLKDGGRSIVNTASGAGLMGVERNEGTSEPRH